MKLNIYGDIYGFSLQLLILIKIIIKKQHYSNIERSHTRYTLPS